jgi:hypothetical protein
MAVTRVYTLRDYIERYGLDVEELAVEVTQRLHQVSPQRREALRQALASDPRLPPPQGETTNFADLVVEASKNLQLAQKLREAVMDSTGRITASVSEVQRALAAADRALDTAAKRWQDLYNTSTAIALEEAVKSTIQTLSDEAYAQFMEDLELRLSQVR